MSCEQFTPDTRILVYVIRSHSCLPAVIKCPVDDLANESGGAIDSIPRGMQVI